LVVENFDGISSDFKELLTEMKENKMHVHLVKREKIINKVNSIDFFFIHMGDSRDFVLADPIRDNKDVFKLFINEVNMDEYRTDYRKILNKSINF
jgi:predicted nucleic acid-binding Zn finger protein